MVTYSAMRHTGGGGKQPQASAEGQWFECLDDAVKWLRLDGVVDAPFFTDGNMARAWSELHPGEWYIVRSVMTPYGGVD